MRTGERTDNSAPQSGKTTGENRKILLIGNSEMAVLGFRRELVEALLERGYEVWVSFPVTGFGDGQTTAGQLGCQYLPIPIDGRGKNPFSDWKSYRHMRAVIRQVRPEAVFTYTIKPNVYGGMAAAGLGIPFVMNVPGLGSALGNTGLLQRLTVPMYRRVAKKARRVFLQNAENWDFFVRHHIAEGNLSLLPGSGVNLCRFPLRPYPTEEDGIHLLFAGRIMREKGIDQYVEAAGRIRARRSDVVFHVAGLCEEEGYACLMEQLDRQGVIRYHGYQSDMRGLFEMCSCTVHPTYYPEGMSNVLLESAATGRPIITTYRSGCREIVEDGVNGLVCKLRDADDLTEKIESFLSMSWQERQRMGLAGRAKVEGSFDRENVVRAYLDELDALERAENQTR